MVHFNWFLHLICLLSSFFSSAKYLTKQSPKYEGLYSQEVINYQLVIPQRVDEHGNFISNLIPHHYKRSTKETDHIFYKLSTAGEEWLIQLRPNLMLTSPGAVFEIHGRNTDRYVLLMSYSEIRLAEKAVCCCATNEHSNKGNTTDEKPGSILEKLKIKKLKNANCHYSGMLKGVFSSKVALSTCFGLAGFIHTKNVTYTIEPVAEYDNSVEDEHPHILYKNEKIINNWTVCNAFEFQRDRREAKENGINSNISGAVYPMYIETLLVMDKSFVNHNKNFDSENYILTVFNMAFSLFHDASLGFLIKLSLVRMIRLETDEDGMDLNNNQDAVQTLESFQEWQYKINPGDDTHPNHHDIAVLITGINTFSNISYGFLGASTLGLACDKKRSAVLCKDSGLSLGFVMAHEIAHLLGAEHDGFNNSCVGVDGDGFRTVMHPQVLLTTETWSRCTRGYIKAFLESGLGNCLHDEPSEHHFNIQDLLPGTIYDADFQCSQVMSSLARECSGGSTCDSLNCHIPGHLCVITKVPPAAGTRCGENMWCRQKKCLMVGERPNAIDGNWGDWSPWSECSRTCGSGVSRSERSCNNPVPSHGGRYCLGKSRRHRICASKPCDMSKPSFRDVQCGEFDDWIYPEDGLKHTWKEYFIHEGNPCILFCINDNLEVVALRPRVIDGTSCYRGLRDVCIDGECKGIPCDLNLESSAIEDVCGVCHGDGTACDFSQGQQFMQKFPKAITKLITVPAGTRNIKVEEVIPSSARILVRDKVTKSFYVRGTKLGMYTVPGSQAWLGMLKSRQEALTIPGPVTKPLTIWIERVENVTVKWSMALPAVQQRKPDFTWDFVRWSSCSALCGPGTQKSEPSCVEEKAGLVESSYCADLEVPQVKVRFCQIAKCEPRWMVADWKGCENASSFERGKKRLVRCVKSFGEGEGESDIVADEECPPPKPQEEEPCDVRYKRDSPKHVIKKSILDNDIVAMFRSNGMKFGSHKKYDEYLKNFNAIATPQRKSETIPLHILNTPHFKHYYRVLQTSENVKSEHKTGINMDITLNSEEDEKTKTNGLLPEMYKNTFSGNQQDYSGQDDAAQGDEDAFNWLNSLFRRKKTMAVGLPRRNCHCRDFRSRRQVIFHPERYHTGHPQKKKTKKGKLTISDPSLDCGAVCTKKGGNKRESEIANRLKYFKKREPNVKRSKLKYPNWKPNLDYQNHQEQEENSENPPENYTIRFGQVLIDKDEDADLEIILEEGDKEYLIGMEAMRPPGEKIWKIRGEEALQFMKNMTSLDVPNKTKDY